MRSQEQILDVFCRDKVIASADMVLECLYRKFRTYFYKFGIIFRQLKHIYNPEWKHSARVRITAKPASRKSRQHPSVFPLVKAASSYWYLLMIRFMNSVSRDPEGASMSLRSSPRNSAYFG
jgi:hypothetical protein